MQPSGSGPVLHGISLEQSAGVLAAIGERIPLVEVLRQEGIDAEVWPNAERAWREAIVDAPDLQIALLQKRRIAEDCLARSVEPIDADPAAWVGLLGAIATSADANALLDGFGLTTGDVARIGRSWRRKAEAEAEAEPKLGKELAELAPTAAPPTKVTAGPMEIRPFPWSPRPRASEKKPARPESPAPSAASATESSADVPRRQLASYQLREQEPVRAPAPALPPAPVLAGPSAPSPTPQPAVAAVGDSTAIAPMLVAAGPAIPFAAIPAAPKPALKQAPLQPKADAADGGERRDLSLDQYAWVVATVRRAKPEERGSVLARLRMTEASYADLNKRWDVRIDAEPAIAQSFATALVRQMALVQPPANPDAAPRAPIAIGDETAAVDMATLRAALPFLGDRAKEAPSPEGSGTVFLPDDANIGTGDKKLPFVPAVPGAAAPARPLAHRLAQPRQPVAIAERPSGTRGVDATLPPRSEAIRQPAVPFGAPSDGVMPLDQYAAISATLVREGNPDATFRRLGIDPVSWFSTVRAYSKRFAEDIALQREFDRLMQIDAGPRR